MCAAPVARRRCLQALAAAALPVPSTRGRAESKITIRLSHVVARQTPKGLALERLRQRLHALSQGRIQVEIYPNSLLYGDADEMQALQLGAVDMLAPSLSKFGPLGFPEFELFDLPFLFDSRAQVRRVTHGAVGRDLLALLARQRMVGLGYLDNGFKHMSANRPCWCCRTTRACACGCKARACWPTRCVRWARGPWNWRLAKRAGPWPPVWSTARKTPAPTSGPST
jgi:C4-dicarboxylate-binding protein DctP